MTSVIQLRSDVTVDLRRHMGGDDSVVEAMLVSTKGGDSIDSTATDGRINYLMKNRHGSPFEHNAMTFYVEAPISVFREWQRHRILSFNEYSARYTEMKPVFYVHSDERPLIQVGKPGNYEFIPGTPEQSVWSRELLKQSYKESWDKYQRLLASGVAKEVARQCLPVGIYSYMYVTFNARSMMHFLSLRTTDANATYPSSPMYEIELCARKLETIFAELFPITYASFQKNGRVSP